VKIVQWPFQTEPKGKVLFLHGWSSDGSAKHTFMSFLGYDVKKPTLSNWFFSSAVASAQEAYDEFQPDVIVGSSRGGAVAMNMESDKPLILLAPAWRRWGTVDVVKNPNSFVIHCPNDDSVPYEDSVKLCENSKGLTLITTGKDHRLNDDEARKALADCLSLLIKKGQAK
jgi:hypothetical protein